MKQIPYIAKDSRGLWTLYVDEKPYLMLGGEIHNSSSSSLPYMKEKVWTGVEGLHLNTLIVPVPVRSLFSVPSVSTRWSKSKYCFIANNFPINGCDAKLQKWSE